MGGVFATMNKRRGNIFDTIEDNNRVTLRGYLPVAESFGFNQDLRANTGGQAFPQCVFDHWETLQEDPYKVGGKCEKMVLDTRKRKGRKTEVPHFKEFCDKL
jgi:elongation factor 2